MVMTPKQKVYVKELETEVRKQKAVRDEMSVINERWVNRCRAAEAALADLVGAAKPITDILTWPPLKNPVDLSFPRVARGKLETLAATVERAQELC